MCTYFGCAPRMCNIWAKRLCNNSQKVVNIWGRRPLTIPDSRFAAVSHVALATIADSRFAAVSYTALATIPDSRFAAVSYAALVTIADISAAVNIFCASGLLGLRGPSWAWPNSSFHPKSRKDAFSSLKKVKIPGRPGVSSPVYIKYDYFLFFTFWKLFYILNNPGPLGLWAFYKNSIIILLI